MKLTTALNRAIQKKILLPVFKKLLSFSSIDSRERGWYRIMESYTGAWQQDVTVDIVAAESYWANFCCYTLISKDVSKMPPYVMQYDRTLRIWKKTLKRATLLRKPNHYQTWIEFAFSWIVCQLRTGNTYVLKVRDPSTNFVIAMYVLDPCRVTPYITSDGGIYYKLQVDELSQIFKEDIYVPASEIIHDRMYPIYHPLIGLPPLFACGIQAMQGNAIIKMSATFFNNRGMPAGILTAPGHIPDDTAERLKTYFDDNFTGINAGKVAVLGDNLKFEGLDTKASDSQLIEQLKMTAEMIAACYHVPGYKIGVGATPSVNNTAALNQQYYDQCLQYIIEKMESRLDEGLELLEDEQCWLDIGALLRMDPQTKSTVLGQRVKDSIISTNEARREDDLEPVEGGDSPMIQQQNYSLGALLRRDNQAEDSLPSGQVASVKDLLLAVANGELPLESVKAMIQASFPTLSEEQINAMLAPLENFEPTTPALEPVPPTSPAPLEDDEDEESEEDEKSISAQHLPSMQSLITATFEKKLPVASAKAMLVKVFKMSDEEAENIIGPLNQIESTDKDDLDELEITQEDIDNARNYKVPMSIEESSEVIA